MQWRAGCCCNRRGRRTGAEVAAPGNSLTHSYSNRPVFFNGPCAQVTRLLPRLTREAYFLEPSLPQLAAMAREDPGSLGAVANFAVGAHGLGRVRWLEPVDVRGLNLDATVRLGKGAVEARLRSPWRGLSSCAKQFHRFGPCATSTWTPRCAWASVPLRRASGSTWLG